MWCHSHQVSGTVGLRNEKQRRMGTVFGIGFYTVGMKTFPRSRLRNGVPETRNSPFHVPGDCVARSSFITIHLCPTGTYKNYQQATKKSLYFTKGFIRSQNQVPVFFFVSIMVSLFFDDVHLCYDSGHSHCFMSFFLEKTICW